MRNQMGWSNAASMLVIAVWLMGTFGEMPPSAGVEASDHVATEQQALGKPSQESSAATKATVQASYGRLPLYFEANQGQTDAEVKFLSRGSGYTLFLTSTEAVLVLQRTGNNGENNRQKVLERGLRGERIPKSEIENSKSAVVRMKFAGDNRKGKIYGFSPLPGKSNYFIGNDPSRWHTNIPHYAKVRYEKVSPGVDLVFYGNQRQLEYDFVVAPGVDPKTIQIAIECADKMKIDRGDLLIKTAAGDLRFRRPFVYQEVNGVKRKISGAYVWSSKSELIGFQVGVYDTRLPLIIDPTVVYFTGADGSVAEGGFGIAVDALGEVYVTGFTGSPDFPATSGALQPDFGGGFMDAFVAKLNAAGSELVYSTYLGGSGSDFGVGIAVNALGVNAYVSGTTFSADFPTTPGAFQPTCAVGKFGCGDVFVTKLNPDGSALVYSTYLGGRIDERVDGDDRSDGIAIDTAGHAYITGFTVSSDFPTTLGASQTTHHGGGDAFVTKLNPTGTSLVYSTYLGGAGHDQALGIAVDAAGNAYVAGLTLSNDFPTTPGVLQPAFGGGSDAFVTKLNADGSALVYSTYLGGRREGGSQSEGAYAIAVDSAGHAYVTGSTNSPDFPVTSGSFQPDCGFDGLFCSDDVFVLKLSPDGTELRYSTYLGGGFGDLGLGIAVDKEGQAYVTGKTLSDFPITPCALQPHSRGVGQETFLTKLDPSGSDLIYSTYLSILWGGRSIVGLGDSYGRSVAVDTFGNAYVLVTPSSVAKISPSIAPFTPCDLKGTWSGLVNIDSQGRFILSISFDESGKVVGGSISIPGVAVVGGTFFVHPTTGALRGDVDVQAPGSVVCFLDEGSRMNVDKTIITGSAICSEPIQITSIFLTNTIITPLAIGTSFLPDGEVNVAYNASLEMSGGLPPYTVSVVEGSLPQGLSVNNDGLISGTPTKAKTPSFTVKVTDQTGSSVSKGFKIKILKTLSIITKSLKKGRVGKSYTVIFKATGGKKPYTWSFTSGVLQAGLTLDEATGKITGIPTESGSFKLAFQVSDPLGSVAEKSFMLTINP